MDATLQQFLNAYWLRPETALWRYIDTIAMKDFHLRSPSLDFGCGDGMFSFLRSGGKLSQSFDVFQATTELDRFFQKRDVFDTFDAATTPQIVGEPSYLIDVAFDHKENLLKKASTMRLYKSFVQGEGNARLPFEDGAFASIFSNILYWLDDPAAVLRELRRIVHREGQICLMLPDVLLLEYSFYNSLYVRGGDAKWAWLDLIDRGRLSDNIKQAKTAGEWEAMFEQAGLRIVQHGQHLAKPIVQIWDVGLRPLFPVLMKMVQAIDADKLPSIKSEWLETLTFFATPLIELERSSTPTESAFHCYVLTHR